MKMKSIVLHATQASTKLFCGLFFVPKEIAPLLRLHLGVNVRHTYSNYCNVDVAFSD